MEKSKKLFTSFITLVLTLFAISSTLALDPNTLPTGGQITSGKGSISQAGSSMTVNQATDRMTVNWNTFNIGQNASVAFKQPSASSVALNRILDQNPSRIYGNLAANGQIYLINPSGVYFGNTARVDVGGLVASSLSLTNENFLAGKNNFEKTGTAGTIINQGSIRTANSGTVILTADITRANLSVTANNDNKTYSGVPYSGGNGVTYAGFIGGETSSVLGGTLAYGGTSQGAVNAGTYSGLTSGNYAVRFVNGVLTITRTRSVTENVSAALTSAQKAIIESIDAALTSTLVTPQTGGNVVLSSSIFSTPVTITATGQTTTMVLGRPETSGAAVVDAGTLPVFTQNGNAPASLQGNFVVHQSSNTISLAQTTMTGTWTAPQVTGATPSSSASFTLITENGMRMQFTAGTGIPVASQVTGAASGSSAPFTLITESGMRMQLTASVSKDGVLTVTAPGSAGSIDAKQAILIGMQVARQELNVELSTLKSALFI